MLLAWLLRPAGEGVCVEALPWLSALALPCGPSLWISGPALWALHQHSGHVVLSAVLVEVPEQVCTPAESRVWAG